MNQINGYYSVVRYCPDPSRQEFVNVGVAIYSPQTKQVKIQLANGNRRLSQVFGKQDLHFINRLKKSLEESLRRESFPSVADLEGYIARSANAIHLGPLRSLKIGDITQDLASLMDRLVGGEPERRLPIQKHLGQKLLDAGVEQYLEKSVNVEIPLLNQVIRVPYAYQNGRYNLISPVEFTADGRDILPKAGEKAIEGQELYEASDPNHGNLHLIVVAKFADEISENVRARVGQIFESHNVAMHNFDNISALVDDIRSAAIQHGLTPQPRSTTLNP
jgi:hypothetical protein